ncbi:Uncharacterised protein [Candidatus Gugararchaeum adminiculabundum]|nr:Uncharacterised protein [Candidatus Gugararchaeum adminiculabundum]
MRFATRQDIRAKAAEHQLVTLKELERRLENGERLFCLSNIPVGPKTRARAVTGSGAVELTLKHVELLLGEDKYNKDPNYVITVTSNSDFAAGEASKSDLTLREYADLFHYYLERYLNLDSGANSEIKNIHALLGQLFATHLWHKNLKNFALGEADLRPLEHYLDHMANTALIFAATFALANERRQIWKPGDPYNNKPQKTYPLASMREGQLFGDVEQVEIPETVFSAFLGALFHDASLALLSPKDYAALCFSQKPPKEVGNHGQESWELIKKHFSDNFLTRVLVRDHHVQKDKKKVAPNIFTSILPIADQWDEYSASEPRLKTLARLYSNRQESGPDAEAFSAFFEIIKPFAKDEAVIVQTEDNGKLREVMSGRVMEANDKLRPTVLITEATGKLARFKGKTKQIDPFAERPLFI